MSYQEVLELVRAGYTKSEIESMVANNEEASTVAEGVQSVAEGAQLVAKDNNDAKKGGVGNLNGGEADYRQKFNDLYNSINDLRAKLIEQNLSQTTVPGRSSETVRDIMANIIAPGGKAHD